MGFDNECILNIQSLPGEYFCPVCRTLVYPSEALQAQCTHLYCKPCLAYVVATTRACPYDGYLVTEADSKPLVESNKSIADGINNIQVHCLYHRSGCSWQGMFSECITHCAECGFGNSPVVCNRCGTQIIHRQVQEHAQICPGVQPQAQQVEGTSALTSAGQDQSAPQAVAHASQVSSSQSAAATAAVAAGTSSSVPITGVSAAISSATQTASSGQTQPQNSGLAQATPTPEQWYQQQQYQQYYQQYPGYDPYQQHYEQSGQYQQQAQLQYPQPYVQSNSQQAVQGQQPLPYIQPQPQALPVSQTHSHPQIPPVAQSHSQSQGQQPVHPQTLPQSQLHGHPQTQMHGPVPQLQATLNPQQQLPHIQMQPQSHTAPPTGLPQSQPLHPPTQGTQIQAPSHPPFQHTSTPQSTRSHVPLTQPQSQSHTQAYPQQPPQQEPHSHPHQIPPQSHPQHPPAHAVSGHQSYPQPQGQQQFPPSAAQQHPVHYPQQQGLPYQQPQLNVQMHNQFPHQQPPQMRPAQSQVPMQAQMGMRPPHPHQPPVQLQMHHHPGWSHNPSAQVQSQQSVRPQVLPYSQQVPAVGQTRLQQAPPFLQATVSSHSSSGQHVGLAPQAALQPSGGNSSSTLVAPGNIENAFDGRKNEYATNKTEQAAAADVDGTSASKIQKQEDAKHGEEKSAIVAEDNSTQPSDVETVPESSFDGKENKEGIPTWSNSNYKEETNGSMEFARSKKHQLDDNLASKVINGEKESEKSIHGFGVEEQKMLKSPHQGTTQCDGRSFDIQSKISGTPSQSRPPPSDLPNIPYGLQNTQGNVSLRAPAPDVMMPQQMPHGPSFGSNFPRPPVQSFPQGLPHQGPGQPMSVPDPFHQPSRQPLGAFPAVAGTPSLGGALGPAGPGMAAQMHAKGQNHPLNAESKMPYADSVSGRPSGGPPAGSFDTSTAMLHRGHGTDGQRYQPGHPDLGDHGHFHDRSPGFYYARPHGPRPSWPLERGPLDQQPGAQHNMSINGPPGNTVEPSFHGSADERFRLLPDERFRHPTGERFRKEFEDDLKQFPRPTSLDREAVPKFDNHFPSARIHERGSHNLGPDSGYRSFERPFDGNAGAIPSRKLPPFPSDAPHADSLSGSYFHSLDAGERQRFYDNFARNEFDHPNFNRPSDYGPHRMDGRSFRSSGQDFANISSSRFGPGGMLHNDEYHERDLRGMGEHSRLFGHPSEPHGNIFHGDRFPNLSPPSGVSSHFRRNEFSASGNMLDFPGSRVPGVGPGGFSHLRHGEPGYSSNYSPHGGSLHGDPFDHSRKRKHGSVGWCRICKIDCETVEGLDLHSQTREHQKMAMDIVLSIKQNNAKKKKLTMEGNMSLDEASKVKKTSTETRKNKH